MSIESQVLAADSHSPALPIVPRLMREDESADLHDRLEAEHQEDERGGEPGPIAQALDEDIADKARDLLTKRAQARADAMTAVARARVRGGRPAEIVSPHDADTAYNVADLLLVVQGQPITELDPAYAPVDKADDDKRRRTASVERVMRTRPAAK